MDKKKLLYAGIIVLVIIGIGISYYLTARTTTVTPPQNTQGVNPTTSSNMGLPGTGNTNSQAMQPTASVASGATDTPEAIAKSFYDWYINYPKDVVATGAYKTSPYLTPDFITSINGFAAHYNPKFDPIFCTGNKTKNYTVSKAMSTHNPKEIKVQILSQNVDNPRPLYDIIVVQQNGVLRIDDVMCD